MHYWGGAAPGTYKCACGLSEQGCESGSTTCECDSGISTSDGGLLQHKDYLPVLELFFGDTGTLADNKVGQHQVKELKCTGDSEYFIFVFKIKCGSRGGPWGPDTPPPPLENYKLYEFL